VRLSRKQRVGVSIPSSFAADFENRLTSVHQPNQTTITFKYDQFGRRIQKGASVYMYDGANLIEEADTGGNLVARYVFGSGIDEPLAAYRGSTLAYYQADGLGSITSLSTTTGTVSDSFTYDSFGNVTSSTGTFTQPFRYTGREWDAETGLYYYRARYYAPTAGDFFSEDPIGFEAGPNFYSYVRNAPTNFHDPSGLLGTQVAPAPPAPTKSAVQAAIDWLEAQAEADARAAGTAGRGILGGVVGVVGFVVGAEGHTANECQDSIYPPSWCPSYRPPQQCKKGKWYCVAKCHINNFSNLPNIPDFVTGEGWGNSKGDAELAAEKDANTRVPRGTYKRHCSFKCEQR